MQHIQIILLIIAILKEQDAMDSALELLYIQTLVYQFQFCNIFLTYIATTHVEQTHIPEGRFNQHCLAQTYKSLFRLEMEEFDILHAELHMPGFFTQLQEIHACHQKHFILHFGDLLSHAAGLT